MHMWIIQVCEYVYITTDMYIHTLANMQKVVACNNTHIIVGGVSPAWLLRDVHDCHFSLSPETLTGDECLIYKRVCACVCVCAYASMVC